MVIFWIIVAIVIIGLLVYYLKKGKQAPKPPEKPEFPSEPSGPSEPPTEGPPTV